jgi:site-specific recombinase XerD
MKFKDAHQLMLLEGQSRHLSSQTIRFYDQRLTAIGRILGAYKDVRKITTADCRIVLTQTSQRSTKHAFVTMRRLFSFLVDEEVLTKSPVSKLKPPKVVQKVVDPISAAEMLQCFKVAKNARGFMGLRDSAIFATLVGTGLRREELCNLRDGDVRLSEGVLLVLGKGRKERFVPIPQDLKKLLLRYKFARDDTKAGSRNDTDRFFRDRNGGVIVPNNLTLLIRRLGQTAGVRLHPHRLRHTFATAFMSNDGSDILTLQAICGWSQLSMAQRYAKPSTEKMQRSMDSFSPAKVLK